MLSFSHLIGALSTLILSKNNLSLSGAEYLAEVIPQMRSIKTLVLSDCHLGDRGVRLILNKLEE